MREKEFRSDKTETSPKRQFWSQIIQIDTSFYKGMSINDFYM